MITGFIATVVMVIVTGSIKNLADQLRYSGIKLSKYAELTLTFMAAVTFFGSFWIFYHFGWWDPPGSNVWNG